MKLITTELVADKCTELLELVDAAETTAFNGKPKKASMLSGAHRAQR